LGDEAGEPVPMFRQRLVRRRPRVDAVAEREVVEPAEETNRNIPANLADDRLDRRILRQPTADPGIEARAAPPAGVGLPEERLCEVAPQVFSRADFACSASAPNACGSLTASSASTLRSSSMLAFFIPATNWLYERPLARAPALIRMIQSRRNVRFFALRSRYAYVSE